jgi:hypothetical protein
MAANTRTGLIHTLISSMPARMRLRYRRWAPWLDRDVKSAVAHWTSFWTLNDPEAASTAMLELFGAAAARAASDCMTAASADGREEDLWFWTQTSALIIATEQRQLAVALSDWKAMNISI